MLQTWLKSTFATTALLLYFLSPAQVIRAQEKLLPVDVLHYDVSLQLDIAKKVISGSVTIRFLAQAEAMSLVEFDCGDLVIDAVREGATQAKFSVDKRRLKISLRTTKPGQKREVKIDYHGSPKYGLRFFPDRKQAYTLFSTSQWMVCVDAPEDKATLTMRLSVPNKLVSVANGRRVWEGTVDDRTVSVWHQRSSIPTYIFGFAVGPFQTVSDQAGRVELRYLSTGYAAEEVKRIFHDTADMLRFFEERAGVRYADRTYTQVLAAGGVEQEMSSFTALRETYGKDVLANEQDLWLGAHEFAHQWWGNMVTCRDWKHFWVNEGVATFMAAAYIEHRFGRANYIKEIESYRANYEKVRAAGKDKSLVFPDWDRPTRDDRTLVYDKGAYALHLLREEMGEDAFWKGLKTFTRRYFGKSVVTENFTNTMQEASAKPLKSFFAKWIYNN